MATYSIGLDLHASTIDGESGLSRRFVLFPTYPRSWKRLASFEVADADLARSVDRDARGALKSWSRLKGHERARLMNGVADVLLTLRDGLTSLETAGNCKLFREIGVPPFAIQAPQTVCEVAARSSYATDDCRAEAALLAGWDVANTGLSSMGNAGRR